MGKKKHPTATLGHCSLEGDLPHLPRRGRDGSGCGLRACGGRGASGVVRAGWGGCRRGGSWGSGRALLWEEGHGGWAALHGCAVKVPCGARSREAVGRHWRLCPSVGRSANEGARSARGAGPLLWPEVTATLRSWAPGETSSHHCCKGRKSQRLVGAPEARGELEGSGADVMPTALPRR